MNSLQHRMDLASRLHEARSEKYMAKFIKNQLLVLNEIVNGKPYTASTFFVPGELLALFDMETIFIERMAGFAAASNILSKATTLDIYSDLPACGCSYQKIFNELIDKQIIPTPSSLVASSFACDDAWMFCKALSIKHNKPFYLIDTLETSEEGGLMYIASQLEELYYELKSRFKEKMSINEIVEISNNTMELKEEIDSLRIQYPGILSSTDALKLFTLYNDLGRTSAQEVLKELKVALRNNLADYKAKTVPKILWLGVIPLYYNRLITDIENKYGCCIVFEELFDFTHQYLTPEYFFNDLAKRITSSMFYSAESRIETILRYVEATKTEGIIHFSQRNCRFLPPMVPVLRRKFEERKVPFVEIQGDAIVPNYFNKNRCFNQLDVFFEMIQRRY